MGRAAAAQLGRLLGRALAAQRHAAAAGPPAALRCYAIDPSPPPVPPPASPEQRHHRGAQQPDGAARRQPPRLVIYRGRWIRTVRYVVRAKVAQLLAAGGVACGLAGLGAGDLTPLDAAVLAGIAMGSVGGSLSLWYYGRRYVGELSLLEPARDTLRFSVLDVWGGRDDVDVPVTRLEPPLRGAGPKAVEAMASQLLFPINVEVPGEGRRQFYVSLIGAAGGQLLEGRLLLQLLRGEYSPPPPGGGAGGAQSERGDQGAPPPG